MLQGRFRKQHQEANITGEFNELEVYMGEKTFAGKSKVFSGCFRVFFIVVSFNVFFMAERKIAGWICLQGGGRGRKVQHYNFLALYEGADVSIRRSQFPRHIKFI